MKKITIICLLIAFAVGFKFLNSASSKAAPHKFHTTEQISAYMDTLRRAPIAAGQYFLPSASCRGCHGYDLAGISNRDEDGDVNLVDRWESSMMALAAKDPFWRAKVSQEIAVNPAHAGILQNKCLDCHAPLGSFTSKYHGNAFYTIADLLTDSLGLDGVSCGSCHAIGPNVGYTYSGNIPYDTTLDGSSYHVEYGPFTAPSVGPMQLYEGFTPTYSTHMDQSKLCSSCHTLITETVDTFGVYTGGYFAEQATYHEYENSNFPANSIKCQTCHMPQLDDPIIIANGFAGLTPRSPFNQHVFAGANSFMLALIKANKSVLGVNVPDNHFDSTIVATTAMLQQKSLNLDLTLESITSDSAFFKVKLENKAGHKFPSGYPSRRAVVQFVVVDASNDTIFQSGMFNNQYRVIGENPAYEPHHNIINQSNVSQIYELVPGDVYGHFTSILERAAVLLKDNRIPPAGFTSASPVYDTVKVSADAVSDPDFNKVSTVEGSGIDYLHFAVPLAGAVGNISVKTKVYYQSVPPKWVDNLFTFTTPEVNTFKPMYDAANQTPVLVASDSLSNILLSTNVNALPAPTDIKVWPTLSMDGKINISADYGTLIKSIEIYNSEGKLQSQFSNVGYLPALNLYLPQTSGLYYLKIVTDKKITYKKVVKS